MIILQAYHLDVYFERQSHVQSFHRQSQLFHIWLNIMYALLGITQILLLNTLVSLYKFVF